MGNYYLFYEKEYLCPSIINFKRYMMNFKFCTFIEPLLKTIDSGVFFKKVFALIYAIFGIFSLITPLYFLLPIIKYKVLSSGFKIAFSVIIIWIIFAFICWIGFQIWWNRKKQLKNLCSKNSKFIAVPLLSHFIKTFGEIFGFTFGILGFIVSIFYTLVFSGLGSYYFMSLPFYNFISSGVVSIIMFPFYGFIIIAISRAFGELLEATSIIANNTSK